MTPSLEGLPTKAKEAHSPHKVRLSPLDTNPVFHKALAEDNFFCENKKLREYNMTLFRLLLVESSVIVIFYVVFLCPMW